jgi:hypothetical protein
LNDSEQNAVTRAGGQGLRLGNCETCQRQRHDVAQIAGGEVDLVDQVIRCRTPTIGNAVHYFRHGAGRSDRQEQRGGREQAKRCLFYGRGRADFLAPRE